MSVNDYLISVNAEMQKHPKLSIFQDQKRMGSRAASQLSVAPGQVSGRQSRQTKHGLTNGALSYR